MAVCSCHRGAVIILKADWLFLLEQGCGLRKPPCLHQYHRLTIVCLRSEEHTSELQSPMYIVCRLLLEKKTPATGGMGRCPPDGCLSSLFARQAPFRPGAVHLETSFFFNDTATTEIYTLSLHDALPI